MSNLSYVSNRVVHGSAPVPGKSPMQLRVCTRSAPLALSASRRRTYRASNFERFGWLLTSKCSQARNAADAKQPAGAAIDLQQTPATPEVRVQQQHT